MMSLNVVYATETGHVVGALALTGPAPAAPVLADLMGTELPLPVTLRDGRAVDLAVAATRLAAAAVGDTRGALAWPMRYGVERVDGVPRPRLAQLTRWRSTDKPVAVRADGVTVSVTEAVTAPTPVFVLLTGGDGSSVPLSGAIPAGATGKTLPVSLAEGPYGVLTLIAGWEGRLDAVSLP